MDVEPYRKLRAQKFLNAIGMELNQKWFDFLESWEINATEQLKLIDDEDWDEFFQSIDLSKMKRKMFEKGLQKLKVTEYDPLYATASIPIQDSTPSSSTSKHSSKKQPATKSYVPKTKSGNLARVTTFFSPSEKKKKTSDTSVKLLTLEASKAPTLSFEIDWRNRHQFENLKIVQDPSPEYERQLWNKDHFYEELEVEKIPDPGPVSNNFEDYLEYYTKLGCGLSRVSSDTNITLAFDKKKKELFQLIRKAHPDRNNGVDKGSEKLKIQLDEIKEVYEKFTTKSAAGFSGRLSYDIQCDVLKNNWRDLKRYNQHEAVQQFQRKMML